MKMKKNQNYEINFATNTIIVSKKFLAAASVMGTDAYKEMLKLRKLGMPIGVKEIHRGKAKEKKWTFTRMEHYLKNVTESDKWMADYNTLKEATCHPDYEDKMEGASVTHKKVSVADNII